MSRPIAWRYAWILLALGGACGCNSSDDNLAPVAGRVFLDGQPLSTGSVITLPEQGRGARGEIDAEGRFTLSSGDLGEGAVIGRHTVAVVAMESMIGLNPEAPRKLLAPRRYTVPETSGLTIDVPASGLDGLELKLTSRPTQ